MCCGFVNLNTKGDNSYYYLMDFGYFCKSNSLLLTIKIFFWNLMLCDYGLVLKSHEVLYRYVGYVGWCLDMCIGAVDFEREFIEKKKF